MPEDKEVVAVVTLGFERLAGQISARDEKVATLSEQMIEVRLKIDQLKESLTNKTETDRLGMRVEQLEKANVKVEQKATENARLIKGLIVSVIVLLIGFLLNFIRISSK